jgi:hypothetical protein
MAGTSWRAVSVPTQKSNGDLPRGPGRVTPSPGRAAAEGSQARVLAGAPAPSKRVNLGLCNGGSMSVPDQASFNIGGTGSSSLDLVMQVTLQRWSADQGSITTWIASQGDHSISQDLCWAWTIHPNGHPRFAVSTTGVDVIGTECDVAYPFSPGSTHWIRVLWLPNVFTLNVTQYFISPPEDGRTWQLIANISSGAAITPRDSSQPITIPGTFVDNDDQITHYFQATFFNGTSTDILEAPIQTLSPRTTSFRDDRGHQWTVNAPGLIGVV